MRTNIKSRITRRVGQAAFTLVEMAVGAGVLAITILALYTAFSQGFAVIEVARENLRATQILQEKTETIRLYTWDQINTPGFIPASFTAPFYAVGASTNSGVVYDGTMTIAPTTLTESYAADLRQVTVSVSWTSGQLTRNRTMTTLVSKYGLHNYIWQPGS